MESETRLKSRRSCSCRPAGSTLCAATLKRKPTVPPMPATPLRRFSPKAEAPCAMVNAATPTAISQSQTSSPRLGQSTPKVFRRLGVPTCATLSRNARSTSSV